MFAVGDYVVSAVNGICRISEVVEMDMSGEKHPRSYFLLIPLEEETARVYIPVETAEGRMRSVIGKEQAWTIIKKIPQISEPWIENDKERERTYKEVILSCNPERLVGILKNMYQRRQSRIAQGKKNTAVDERYFKQAEEHLYSELAFAIGEEKTKMQSIIEQQITSL